MDGSLDVVRADYPDTELEFCNGGDRSPDADTLPAEEVAAAQRNRHHARLRRRRHREGRLEHPDHRRARGVTATASP